MPGPSKPQPQQVTSTTQASLPGFIEPFVTGQGLEGALEGASEQGFLPRIFAESAKPFEALPGAGERLAGFDPSQELGLNLLTERGLAGSPETTAASDFITQGLSANPLDNPQVQQQIAQLQGGLVDQFNLNVAPQIAGLSRSSGSFGNTGVAEFDRAGRFGLARALGDVSTNVLSNERGRQTQLAALAPTLSNARLQDIQGLITAGSARQAQQQQGLDINFQNLLEQRLDPLRKLDILGSGITTGVGGARNTTSTGQQFLPPQPNPFLSAIGAGGSFLGGAGLLASGLSSRQFKHNIRPASGFLEKLKNLDLHFWSYKGETERHVGPMAEDWQEVMGVGDGKTLAFADMLAVIMGAIKEMSEKTKMETV